MIKSMVSLMMIAATSVYASTESASVYALLNVEEQSVAAERTMLVYSKSVGGLTCLKKDHITRGVTYSCSVNIDQLDAAAIYHALNITEQVVAAPRTELKYQKTADGISCVKTDHIMNDVSFTCDFSF